MSILITEEVEDKGTDRDTAEEICSEMPFFHLVSQFCVMPFALD